MIRGEFNLVSEFWEKQIHKTWGGESKLISILGVDSIECTNKKWFEADLI